MASGKEEEEEGEEERRSRRRGRAKHSAIAAAAAGNNEGEARKWRGVREHACSISFNPLPSSTLPSRQRVQLFPRPALAIFEFRSTAALPCLAGGEGRKTRGVDSGQGCMRAVQRRWLSRFLLLRMPCAHHPSFSLPSFFSDSLHRSSSSLRISSQLLLPSSLPGSLSSSAYSSSLSSFAFLFSLPPPPLPSPSPSFKN